MWGMLSIAPKKCPYPRIQTGKNTNFFRSLQLIRFLEHSFSKISLRNFTETGAQLHLFVITRPKFQSPEFSQIRKKAGSNLNDIDHFAYTLRNTRSPVT